MFIEETEIKIFDKMEKQIKFIQNNLFNAAPYMTLGSINDFYNIVQIAIGRIRFQDENREEIM